jgi:hypothetical protein
VRGAGLRTKIDGVIVQLDGPTVIYASEGGGTWYATGEGGYPPYNFNWYLNDYFVGTGSSWTGYNQGEEGPFLLRVDIFDSGSASHSDWISVHQIGGSDCDPVPPQVTCEG